jgi:amylosucrase
LCGLEAALQAGNDDAISTAVNRIILMQAQSILLGGLPMLFYGDEVGYTNDYSYLADTAKAYDNRWMHRPLVDWKKNELRQQKGTIEARIFSATQRLIAIRKLLTAIADLGNINWMIPHNIHVAGFARKVATEKIYCLFNYSNKPSYLTWFALRENGDSPKLLFDHWHQKKIKPGGDHEYLVLEPYGVYILEAKMD